MLEGMKVPNVSKGPILKISNQCSISTGNVKGIQRYWITVAPSIFTDNKHLKVFELFQATIFSPLI